MRKITGNKTKRKKKNTKRKMKNTKRKMKIKTKKIIRKRNKVKLHNTLMKGGVQTTTPNLFGIQIPGWLFHDPPEGADMGRARDGGVAGGDAERQRILKDYKHFNIPKILEWLGISVSRLVINACELSSTINPNPEQTDQDRSFRDWIADKCTFRWTQTIEFDIKKYNDGYNLIIDYFYLTIYLEVDPENRASYVSPSIKFNMKEILKSILGSQGYGKYYSEGLNPFSVSVIEPFRDEDVSIRFEYEILNLEGNYKGVLRLRLEQNVARIIHTLIIGEINYANESLTREISRDIKSGDAGLDS